AGEQAGLLQRRARLGIDFDERAGDGHAQCTGLPADAATVPRGVDVVVGLVLGDAQRFGDCHALHRRREVVVERLAVDRVRTVAGTKPGASDGLLATTGGLGERFGCHEIGSFPAQRALASARSRTTGSWAAWGCSGPA